MLGIIWFTVLLLTVLFVSAFGDMKNCGPYNSCLCTDIEPDGLVDIDCTGTGVPLVEVCHFTSIHFNITTLSFSSNNLAVLTSKDLNGCENIQRLSLRNISLSQVESDAFQNIRYLSMLDLSQNKLDIYSGNKVPYLYKLTSIKELRLNGNFKIESSTKVSYPWLSDLPGLETLYLDGLSDITFNSNYLTLRNLHCLVLSGSNGFCNLTRLTNKTFVNIPGLTKLCLSNCSLINVYAGTFSDLQNLTWLDLSMNKQLGFKTLRNISYSLQFTQIDFLNLSTVHNTFGLGTMLMRRDVCYLTNTTLREIVLDSNRLQLIETNLFLLLPDTLQVIHTRDNIFTFGLYLLQLACMPNVTAMYIDHQKSTKTALLYLDDPIQTSVFISKRSVDCVYDSPDYLSNRSLAIPNCNYFQSAKITKSDIYNATIPKELKIVSYQDSNVVYSLQDYPVRPFDNSIETIDLSGNVLYSWIGPIGPFPSIKTLNLSRNYCSHVHPNMFLFMSSLEYLYVQQNFLGITLANDANGSTFQHLINLKLLDLSTNQIRKLPPGVFLHLGQLQVLNLSFNSLIDWKADTETLPKLQYIDLQSNALSEVSQSLMAHFDNFIDGEQSLFSINMKNNPFKCICKYEQFLTWMVKHRSSFVEFETYSFTDDSGQHLEATECILIVNNFSKTCRSYTVLIYTCIIGIILFISLIISGLMYKNRWKLRYLLYMNKRRFFGYRAVPDYEPIENYRYDAFISYADENIRFILDGIIPKLQTEHGIELCIHQRDFVAGNAVTDNIVNAIQSSKKTVIILSKAFLKSKWCIYEFHMARMESIYSREGKSILIVVMLENVPPSRLMPLEMIEWIKLKSYIEYTNDEEGNMLFWENLKVAIQE